MPNQIDALMGLVGTGQEDQQALSRQLRSDRDLGQFMGLSGNKRVSQMGRTQASDALKAAGTAGTRRNQGLARARQAEQDTLVESQRQFTRTRQGEQDVIKAEALEYGRKGYSDIKNQTVDDVSAMWGKNNQTGVYEMVPGTEGMKTTKSGGKTVWPVNIPGSDEKAFWNSDTGKVTVPRLGNREFDGLSDPMLAESLSIVAGGAGEIESSKTLAKGWADEAIDVAVEMRESGAASFEAQGHLDTMINEIDKGALTGKAWSYFPTLTDPTAAFESAVAGLTLAELTNYKLTPVSDRDLAMLKSKAAPDMYPTEMKLWAAHKKESLRRIQAGNKHIENYIRQEGKIPTGAEAEKLQKEAEAITKEGGFDFLFKRQQPSTQATQLSQEEAIQAVQMPEFVNQEDWDSFTPEQQQQLAQ